MPNVDVRICDLVRKILSRHWIDLSDIRFTCTRGVLRFNGTMRRLDPNERQEFRKSIRSSGFLLENLGREIKAIDGVKKVYFTGVRVEDNWVEM